MVNSEEQQQQQKPGPVSWEGLGQELIVPPQHLRLYGRSQPYPRDTFLFQSPRVKDTREGKANIELGNMKGKGRNTERIPLLPRLHVPREPTLNPLCPPA